MAIESLDYLYRFLLIGIGMMLSTLLRGWYPTVASTCSHWYRTVLDRLSPGRGWRQFAQEIEAIAESQKRTHSDLKEIRTVLDAMLDAREEKVARPFRPNGLAQNQD